MAQKRRIKLISPKKPVQETGFFICKLMKWYMKNTCPLLSSVVRRCWIIKWLKVCCLSTVIFGEIMIIIMNHTHGIKIKSASLEMIRKSIPGNLHNPFVAFLVSII